MPRLLTYMGLALCCCLLAGCGSTSDPVVVTEREVTAIVTPATSAPVLMKPGAYTPFDGYLLSRDATLAVMNGGSTNQYAQVEAQELIMGTAYLFHPDIIREKDGYVTYKKPEGN